MTFNEVFLMNKLLFTFTVVGMTSFGLEVVVDIAIGLKVVIVPCGKHPNNSNLIAMDECHVSG